MWYGGQAAVQRLFTCVRARARARARACVSGWVGARVRACTARQTQRDAAARWGRDRRGETEAARRARRDRRDQRGETCGAARQTRRDRRGEMGAARDRKWGRPDFAHALVHALADTLVDALADALVDALDSTTGQATINHGEDADVETKVGGTNHLAKLARPRVLQITEIGR